MALPQTKVPYQIIERPKIHQLPSYIPAPEKIPLHLCALVVMVLKCTTRKGQVQLLRWTELIKRKADQDFDFNSLEPELVRLQQILEFMAGQKGLNAQEFVDPAKVPAPKLN